VPDPIVVTYQGGSAGDMFAAGANGIKVDFSQREYVHQPSWSIKKQEPLIKQGKIDLSAAIRDKQHDFVTTHIYEPLRVLKFATISIIMSDPDAIEQTIMRQMKLQMLSIEINPAQTAYNLIKKSVDQQRWQAAAISWFAMAKKNWYQDLAHRTGHALPNSKVLVFDRLYHEDFVDSLSTQGFSTNLDVIECNHRTWLSVNSNQTFDTTVQSMVHKLQRMDWNQKQGFVTYDKC